MEPNSVRLTDAQWNAAICEDKAVLVTGIAGSGKTTVLLERMKRLLISPEHRSEHLLVLTFTRVAAGNIRRQLLKILPDAERRASVSRVHGFCEDVIRANSRYVGVNSQFTLYEDDDMRALLESVIQTRVGSSHMMTDAHGVDSAMEIIKYFRRSLRAPSEIASYIEDRETRAFYQDVYQEYDNQLTQHNAMDHDTLLFKTCELFQHHDYIADKYRQLFNHILVDEFQNFNTAQYKLLSYLAGADRNKVFVVMDEAQRIYSRLGASSRLLESFRKDYEPTNFELVDSFRCPENIVAIGSKLLLKNRSYSVYEKRDISNPFDSDSIRVLAFPTPDQQMDRIVQEIADRVKQDSAGRIGVFLRNKKRVAEICAMLRAAGVTVHSGYDEILYGESHVGWLYNLLSIMNKRSDTKLFESLVAKSNKLTLAEPLDPDELMMISSSMYNGDLVKAYLHGVKKQAGLPSRVVQSLEDDLLPETNVGQFLTAAWNWLDENVEQGDKDSYDIERQRFWLAVEEQVTQGKATVSTVLEALHNRFGEQADHALFQVDCRTIFTAIGQEYNHVYILDLVEGELPPMGLSVPELEEERRICFVGITRTRETLTLCYYLQDRDGSSARPSRFLKDMELL